MLCVCVAFSCDPHHACVCHPPLHTTPGETKEETDVSEEKVEEAMEEEKEDEICAICHDAKVNPYPLDCGHSFCATCYIDHLEQQNRLKVFALCPYCRLIIE